jgi:hypothetical protein
MVPAMTRRLLIFGLLGPALSACALSLVSFWDAGADWSVIAAFVAIVAVINAAPLLLCGGVDFVLSKLPRWERAMVVAVAAACLSTGVLLALGAGFFKHGALVTEVVLSTLIPAVICSLISERKPRGFIHR